MKQLITAIAAVTVMFGFGAAAQAQYPPSSAGVSIANPNPDPGETVIVVVTGCQPNEAIDTVFNGAAGTVVADATGGASIALVAPSEPGVVNGSVTCNGQTTNFQVNVLAATSPTTPSTGLPATGANGPSETLVVAIGVLVTGLGLLGVAQVRRRQTLGV